jgi:enoyl-[acyl-carrier protein] reductase I
MTGMDGIMKGKRGLIMGVANDHSIAWGIAKQLANAGAELAFTYQGEGFGRRVKPLAESVGSKLMLPCDVEDIATVDQVFERLKDEWGTIDFVVHAIGFSDKSELKGRYADVTTRANFSRTMVISAYSFTEVAQRAAPMMREGGSILTLTYGGSMRVMPNYNVMGVAKAALEAMVRYLAADYGQDGIRVNAISAGPVRTLAGAGIGDAQGHVQLPEKECATAPDRRYRRCRQVGALPAFGPFVGRDRRDPLRGFGLQHHLDADRFGIEADRYRTELKTAIRPSRSPGLNKPGLLFICACGRQERNNHPGSPPWRGLLRGPFHQTGLSAAQPVHHSSKTRPSGSAPSCLSASLMLSTIPSGPQT